jgi:adenylate cyclase
MALPRETDASPRRDPLVGPDAPREVASGQRKLVAVLAADIVGYSRLMEADEEDTHKRVLLLRATTIDPTIAKYRGQVIKNTGDGFLAVFDSANDASRCALAIQHGANAMSAEEPEHRFISLRMGINIADAIFEQDDIYGDGVNIAARLQTYSEPGGIVVSGAVADQISEQAGVSAVDLGDLHLRNLSRPVKAFGLRIERSPHPMADSPVRAQGRPSIVVLPFRNLANQEDAYFAEGIVDEIIHALSALKELFVISRGSTLGYGSEIIDIRAIGRELGVRYVLYGSVRRSGGRLRINTELNDTESGNIIYSDRHEGELSELFALQEQMSTRVVTTIAPHVREWERARALRKHPQNLTAYDLVLQALSYLYRMDYDSFSRARGLLQQAVTHDPNYAPAYSYLAYWYMFRVGQGWSTDAAADSLEASRNASKAIERDGNDALALAIDGHVHSYLFKDFETATRLLDRAITVGPNSAMAWTMNSATCGYLGEGSTAVLRAEHGLRLSPLDSHVFWHEHLLSQAHYINGNFDEAAAWGWRAAKHNERFTSNLRILAASLVAIGKFVDARQIAQNHLRIDPNFHLQAWADRTPLNAATRDNLWQRLKAAGFPD